MNSCCLAAVPIVEPSWEDLRMDLFNIQRANPVHPFHEKNIDSIRKVTDLFVKLFRRAPLEKRPELAKESLFPADVQLHHKDSACPLNYILFTANRAALNMLKPYLSKDDWAKRGCYQSTVMHDLVKGISKKSGVDGDPVGCAKVILEQDRNILERINEFGEPPSDCLFSIIVDLAIEVQDAKDLAIRSSATEDEKQTTHRSQLIQCERALAAGENLWRLLKDS